MVLKLESLKGVNIKRGIGENKRKGMGVTETGQPGGGERGRDEVYR